MSDAAFYAIPDQIDLRRLVRKLDIPCLEQEWSKKPYLGRWIQAQGALQRVAHARKLLRNVEGLETERVPPRAQQLEEIKVKLDEVEGYVIAIKESSTPKPVPTSLLSSIRKPSLPLPSSSSSALTLDLPSDGTHVNAPSSSTSSTSTSANPRTVGAPTEPPTDELLLPADTSFATSNSFSFPTPMPLTGIRPTLASPSTTTTSTSSAFATGTGATTATATGVSTRFSEQNTKTLHSSLTTQLAHMATQLRTNAEHFNKALIRDKEVIETLDVKIESNFDRILGTVKRTVEQGKKSNKTTWLVYGVVGCVVGLFVVMVLVIRATRWL